MERKMEDEMITRFMCWFRALGCPNIRGLFPGVLEWGSTINHHRKPSSMFNR